MTKKKQTTAQAKGRMAVAAREQEKARGRLVDAIHSSGYNSSKVYNKETKKYTNTDGATYIMQPQRGNRKVSAVNAGKIAAANLGKKPAKKGK